MENKLLLNDEFLMACSFGDLNVVNLLESDIENLQDSLNLGLQWASANGHIEVVHYLLTSPICKEKINIHHNNDSTMKSACMENRINIIEYLIFDYNIEKTNEIINYMAEYDLDNIQNFFVKRELKEKLTEDLTKESNNYVKPSKRKV